MTQPNLVLFLTDDHGHWTLPCYGNKGVRAPVLSELAGEGTVFANAFTPSPVCSPARASLLTGRIPSAHGIHDWIPEAKDDGTFPHIDAMPGNLVEQLRAAGYVTAYAGKYHCNHAKANPLGFDCWFTQKPPYNYNSSGPQSWYDNGRERLTEGPQAPVITEAALRFLRGRDRSKPFCLLVGHINTHAPHTGEEAAFVDHYRRLKSHDMEVEPFHDAHGSVRFLPKPDPAHYHEQTAQYFAAVEAIDHEVGRVVDELKKQSLMENTCLFYTSDHGHMNGHHGLHTKGNATVPVNFLEESIRVPLLVSGPGIPGGRRIEAFTDHCDLHATLLDLAGAGADARAPDGTPLPGISRAACLRGGNPANKPYQFCEYGNARMIRDRRYKLIRRFPGPNGHFPDEFYDLETDPRETCNLFHDPEAREGIDRLSGPLEDFFSVYSLPERSGLRMENLAQFHKTSCWNIDPVAFPVIYQ